MKHRRLITMGAVPPAAVIALLLLSGQISTVPRLIPESLPASVGTASLYVRDLDRWEADRYQARNTEFQSPALRVRREVLFSALGVEAGTYNVDVRRLLERILGG